MAKRSTDLLEVFNRKPQQRGGSRRTSGKTRKKRGSAKRGGFDGLVLGPRQVLLSSCVLVLLLVLSFVVGVGMGRRGDDAAQQESPRLRRDQPAGTSAEVWYVLGRTTQVHQVRGERLEPYEIPGELGLGERFVHVEVVPEGYYDVFVGPFRTEADARDYWRRADLETRGRKIDFPFALPSYVRRRPF